MTNLTDRRSDGRVLTNRGLDLADQVATEVLGSIRGQPLMASETFSSMVCVVDRGGTA